MTARRARIAAGSDLEQFQRASDAACNLGISLRPAQHFEDERVF